MDATTVQAVCTFCLGGAARVTSFGLTACEKCETKYAFVCWLYLQKIRRVIGNHYRSWDVRMTPAVNHSRFQFVLMKGNVRILTSVDKSAFYAVISRLYTDSHNLQVKKSRIPKEKRRGKKAVGRPARKVKR